VASGENTRYLLVVVTSVSRDGKVKEFQKLGEATVEKRDLSGLSIVDKGRIADMKALESSYLARGDWWNREFETLDDVKGFVGQFLSYPAKEVDPKSETKAELLGVLRDGDSTERDVYDYLIDYLYEERCFLGKDQRPCMFESYGTVIDFLRVMPALSGFPKVEIGRMVVSLRECRFTPLSGVLATFIEKRATALVESMTKDQPHLSDGRNSLPVYRPELRPVSFATMPAGVKWEFIEAPWDLAHVRADLPRSSNRHGLISTDRPLTDEEREQFGLVYQGVVAAGIEAGDDEQEEQHGAGR
jgi:hypothetical protein